MESAEPSFSAYSNTLLSISSTLDMEYLFDAKDRFSQVTDSVRQTLPGRANRDPVQTIAGDNRSVAFLQQIGYRYLHFEGRTFHVTRCRGFEDACISGMPSRRSDLLTTLLAQLPLPLFSAFSSELANAARPVEKGERSASGTGIPELAAALEKHPIAEPFFLYAHIFSPHAPFTNDAECRPTIQRRSEDYLDDFLAQLQCVNRQLLALVDGILERDPNAVILVNSDHGPRFSAPDGLSIFEFGPAQIYEHLSVLNAIRLPQPCRRFVRPGLSPLNTLRLVFACLGGHAPHFVEERHFIAAVRPDHPEYGLIREVELH